MLFFICISLLFDLILSCRTLCALIGKKMTLYGKIWKCQKKFAGKNQEKRAAWQPF